MKRFNLSAWAVSHPALVMFLIVALGVAGFFSYQKLGRAEDPFFTVKVVNVSVMWPGATAKEIQTQVADPLEKKLQELPYFDKVQTYSKPGFTALQVTFRDLFQLRVIGAGACHHVKNGIDVGELVIDDGTENA